METEKKRLAPITALARFIDREPLKAWLWFCASTCVVAALLIGSALLEQDRAHEDYWEMTRRHQEERLTRTERVPYETDLEMSRRHSHEKAAVEIQQACHFDEACVQRQEAARFHVGRIRWAISSDEDRARRDFLDEVYSDAFRAGYSHTEMDWIAARRFIIRASYERGITIFNECTVPYNDCYVGELR